MLVYLTALGYSLMCRLLGTLVGLVFGLIAWFIGTKIHENLVQSTDHPPTYF